MRPIPATALAPIASLTPPERGELTEPTRRRCRRLPHVLGTTVFAAVLALAAPNAPCAEVTASEEITYRVRQTVTVGPFDAAAKRVACWVSIPDDDPNQVVLDLAVASAPGEWAIVKEPRDGNRFLYVQAVAPKATSLDVVVDFVLRRRSVSVRLANGQAGALDPAQRTLFAEELREDSPHMEVTREIRQLAAEVCGSETNSTRRAQLLLAKVAEIADHYSKDKTKPQCGIGDAEDCLTNGGGCCTDLHSLFIALARSAGVPARLQMGYRLLPKNDGKLVDPGYRCWVEYFAPGNGWTPADIVEADAPEGLGPTVWFSGLTAHRLWLNQGREFRLPHAANPQPVNHMSIGYAEVDDRPIRLLPEGDLPAQISRKIQFDILGKDAPSHLPKVAR
ncbi:MAG: transglutaminase-like domain-containing protein [Planctomycetota bacterium]